VSAVKAEAKEHVAGLESVARTLESRDNAGDEGLAVAIASQSRLTSQLMTSLRTGQLAQRDATGEVVAAAARIDKFVSIIGDIATGLRVLTLNARIEAARRGAQGAAFATIADSMRSLATEVQRANEGIGVLSSELTVSAAKAQEIDTQMHELTVEAERGMGTELERLRGAFDGVQRASVNAAREGVVSAERLANLTNDILSHLQFQDRMAQILYEVNSNLEKSRDVTLELLERAEHEDIDAITNDLRMRAGNASVRLSGESELDSSERDMESGVVLMF
jgi:methyl-accepting chemotaxis protein